MKYQGPATLQKALIGVLIVSLCLLPLVGLHIHLAETHLGAELHSHQAETHGFHLHTAQHDNIDAEVNHQSDTQQIELDTDTRLVKVFKLLAFIVLAVIVQASYIASRLITRLNYVTPFLNPFEIFRARRRGPPAV